MTGIRPSAVSLLRNSVPGDLVFYRSGFRSERSDTPVRLTFGDLAALPEESSGRIRLPVHPCLSVTTLPEQTIIIHTGIGMPVCSRSKLLGHF